jgi:hypothetical protein
MGWLKKLFSRKVTLSHVERIQIHTDGIADALDVFKKAHQQIVDGNLELATIGQEIDSEIAALNTIRTGINDKVIKNNLIADKFAQFAI